MNHLYVDGKIAPREAMPERILEKSVFGNSSLGASHSGVESFVTYGASNSNLLPRWWNQDRDNKLKQASLEVDLLSSTVNTLTMKLYNLPLRIVPKNNMIASHAKLSEIYDGLIQTAWLKYGELFLNDLLTQDKGGFLIVEGTRSLSQPFQESDVPTGIKYISSSQILLNNNENHPYIWVRDGGDNIKLHESRVIRIMQNPMSVMDNVQIGFSYVSKSFNIAQVMAYAVEHGLESLGALESDTIIYGTGINSKSIRQAFKDAQIDSINSGQIRSGKRVYLGMRDANAKLGTLNLKRLPEGFNFQEFTTTTLKLMAVAAGVDEDDFVSTSTSGSSKTATLISEQKNKWKLVAWFSKKFSSEIQAKFLPSVLKMRVGTSEENVNESTAKAWINIARVAKIQSEIGVTNTRESRINAERNGTITTEQFNRLELEDGRLPDGLPVRALFFSNDPLMQKLLNLPGIPEPCQINDSDSDSSKEIDIIKKQICEVERIAVNTTSANIHSSAMTAKGALTWLLEEYEDLLAIQQEELAIVENIPDPNLPVDDDSTEDELEPSENPQEAADEEIPDKKGISTQKKRKARIERPTGRIARERQSKAKKIVKKVWNNESDFDLQEFLSAVIDDPDEAMDEYGDELEEFSEFLETNKRKDGALLNSVYGKMNQFL